MSTQVQLLVAFLLYLAFFAWIGYRRGLLREILVLVVALGSYVGLGEFQGKLIFLINTGWAFVAAGGPTTAEELLEIFEAPKLIGPEQQSAFIFLLWAILLVLAYGIGNVFIKDARSKSGGLSSLIGMANGFVYSLILLPILTRALISNGAAPDTGEVGAETVVSLARQSAGNIGSEIGALWGSLAAQRSFIILVLVTLVVLSAARTLTKAR